MIGLVFCGAVLAQEGYQAAQGGDLPFNANKHRAKSSNTPANASSTATPTPFSSWYDPISDQAINRGVFDQVGGVVTPVFCDSTVKYQNANGTFSTVGSIFVGLTLDPQSQLLNANGAPVVTANDPYNLDSLSILTRYYMRDTTKHDTMYIYLVWGKPTDANIYSTLSSSAIYGTNFAGLRANYTNVKVKGASGTPGPVVTPAATKANYRLIKYPLKKSDTVKADNYAVYIDFKIDTLTIPAGNVLSLFYTYVPEAGSTQLGDVFYNFPPSTGATKNGFAAQIWQEKGLASIYDIKDLLLDPSTPHAGPLLYNRAARYGLNTTIKDIVYGYPGSAPIVFFKISGNSTVGINETSNNIFSLEQNVPNPFNNETAINYQLKSSAKNVSVVVYNLAGVKVFEDASQNLSAGKYTTKVNSSNLSAGVYFYSLIVDEHRATKKMVITE